MSLSLAEPKASSSCVIASSKNKLIEVFLPNEFHTLDKIQITDPASSPPSRQEEVEEKSLFYGSFFYSVNTIPPLSTIVVTGTTIYSMDQDMPFRK